MPRPLIIATTTTPFLLPFFCRVLLRSSLRYVTRTGIRAACSVVLDRLSAQVVPDVLFYWLSTAQYDDHDLPYHCRHQLSTTKLQMASSCVEPIASSPTEPVASHTMCRSRATNVWAFCVPIRPHFSRPSMALLPQEACRLVSAD